MAESYYIALFVCWVPVFYKTWNSKDITGAHIITGLLGFIPVFNIFVAVYLLCIFFVEHYDTVFIEGGE